MIAARILALVLGAVATSPVLRDLPPDGHDAHFRRSAKQRARRAARHFLEDGHAHPNRERLLPSVQTALDSARNGSRTGASAARRKFLSNQDHVREKVEGDETAASRHKRKDLRQLAQRTCSILTQKGVKYWLDFSTLLGLMREHNILEGDNDVDISVEDTPENRERLESARAPLADMGVFLKKELTWNAYRAASRLGYAHLYLTPLVDHTYKGAIGEGSDISSELIGTPQLFDWQGTQVSVPQHTHAVLVQRYGHDYLDPDAYYGTKDFVGRHPGSDGWNKHVMLRTERLKARAQGLKMPSPDGLPNKGVQAIHKAEAETGPAASASPDTSAKKTRFGPESPDAEEEEEEAAPTPAPTQQQRLEAENADLKAKLEAALSTSASTSPKPSAKAPAASPKPSATAPAASPKPSTAAPAASPKPSTKALAASPKPSAKAPATANASAISTNASAASSNASAASSKAAASSSKAATSSSKKAVDEFWAQWQKDGEIANKAAQSPAPAPAAHAAPTPMAAAAAALEPDPDLIDAAVALSKEAVSYERRPRVPGSNKRSAVQHESDRAFMALGNVIQHHKQVLDNLQVQFDQVNDKHPDVRERLAGQITKHREAVARAELEQATLPEFENRPSVLTRVKTQQAPHKEHSPYYMCKTFGQQCDALTPEERKLMQGPAGNPNVKVSWESKSGFHAAEKEAVALARKARDDERTVRQRAYTERVARQADSDRVALALGNTVQHEKQLVDNLEARLAGTTDPATQELLQKQIAGHRSAAARAELEAINVDGSEQRLNGLTRDNTLRLAKRVMLRAELQPARDEASVPIP